ncbi:MAG: iron ABC transporter permease [Syntrophomonas sp.]|nr:iron ABC transporter permease [Syntrophomonas sp.]
MHDSNSSEIDLSIKTKKDVARKFNKKWILLILSLLLIATFAISFTLGRYAIPLSQLFEILFSKLFGFQATWDATMDTVLFKVRLPRLLAAIMIGAVLSLSGATYQGLFKNPMVSADILGASAGAGFGAAIAMLLSFDAVGIQLMSFAFGLGAVAITTVVSTIVGRGNDSTLLLVLTGMVVTSLFSSAIALIKYVADPDLKLREITFWLMGGLSAIRMSDLKIVLIPMILGAVPLLLLRWKLNVLSFGDEEAQAMGIDTSRLRLITIICSTLLTASTVSIGGIIGWVGLVIPHLARMLVGPNYSILLPTSLLVGGLYLLIVDNVARCMFAMEIPLGILTSVIGAPFFIYLLMHGKRGWV